MKTPDAGEKAIDGSLSIMADCDRKLFESVKYDIPLKMGASVVYFAKDDLQYLCKILCEDFIVAIRLGMCKP